MSCLALFGISFCCRCLFLPGFVWPQLVLSCVVGCCCVLSVCLSASLCTVLPIYGCLSVSLSYCMSVCDCVLCMSQFNPEDEIEKSARVAHLSSWMAAPGCGIPTKALKPSHLSIFDHIIIFCNDHVYNFHHHDSEGVYTHRIQSMLALLWLSQNLQSRGNLACDNG